MGVLPLGGCRLAYRTWIREDMVSWSLLGLRPWKMVVLRRVER